MKKSSQMTFHVVSLPHTQTTMEYEACAYTSKTRKFCNMMKSLGHKVYLYASEENEANVDELITIAPKDDQQKWFGDNDFKQNFFNLTWNIEDEHWQNTNRRAISQIKKRINKKDFICIIGGVCQKQIADAFPAHMSVEYGIGYEGVFAPFRVYESYSHMHYVQGKLNDDNGRFYDAVIPNYFEPENFQFKNKKEDYFLFLGRFIPRKGVEIAVEVTRRLGKRLVLAGQGVSKVEGNTIYGDDFSVSGDHILHVGHANVAQRSALLRNATATFMATTYIEPFGGVAIESLLCGTPVIATDFGAFAENIQHGVHGYRFRTIGEAVWGAKNVHKLNNKVIHEYAVENFSVERVKYLYQAYFEQLQTLWEEGFYSNWDKGVAKYQRYKKFS
ncbi:MAG: glycosyltransferase [Candidatus Nomurabacteria bacterium]|nr:MAG: glycosyltransferase [Candidatus Nomurabacteria bacterium]